MQRSSPGRNDEPSGWNRRRCEKGHSSGGGAVLLLQILDGFLRLLWQIGDQRVRGRGHHDDAIEVLVDERRGDAQFRRRRRRRHSSRNREAKIDEELGTTRTAVERAQ